VTRKRTVWSAVAVVSLLMLCTGVLYISHVVQVASYGKVTHHQITKLANRSLKGDGVEITQLESTIGDHFISENAVLRVTNPIMKLYKGTSRNIVLVNTSRRSATSYVRMTTAEATGDPHIQNSNGNWLNIPCYIVTIDGGMIVASAGPALNPQMPTGPNVVVVVVDATSGQVLMDYQLINSGGN
jgi:hypothetical protein